MTEPRPEAWPDIPYASWAETCAALHLWCQIVGKYRLRHTPWVNHSWHATLYVSPRGLTTGTIPDPGGAVSVAFDFRDHALRVTAADGRTSSFALSSMSVAEFMERFRASVESVGGDCDIHGRPNELPNPVSFTSDTETRPYDGDAVQRFHRALLDIDGVFLKFRTGFQG